jgi:hypothetical protein
MLIYGSYKFRPTVTGYRSDWCNVCKKEVVSYQYRHLYIGHIFWVPLLPLGRYKIWRCTQCKLDPRTRVQTSMGFYIGGIIALLLMLALLVFRDVSQERTTQFGLIAACIVGIAALSFGLRRRLREPPISHEVKPLAGSTCLLCHTPLPGGEEPICSNCGAKRV